MERPRFVATLCITLGWMTALSAPASAQDVEQVPTAVQEEALEDPAASPTLLRILEATPADSSARRALELFHGRWEDFTPGDTNQAAALAWGEYRLDDPALDDPQADPLVRAEAHRFRGEAEKTLALLAKDDSVRATLLKAQAHEARGETAAAVGLLTPLRDRFQHETIDDPAELTAAARSIVMLAHLEGRPAQDYRLALGMLGRATQELDPLYWPAHVAEGELLMTKDNREEAAAAFEQALSLNPQAGAAWSGLGRLAVDGFNFDLARQVSARLRNINPDHPLAAELDVRSFLKQRDVASARQTLATLLDTMPQRRETLALAAAAEGLAYDEAALEAALAAFDRVATNPDNPGAAGSALALHTAGEVLASDRQYGRGEDLLRRAIARSPNWPAPRLTLGLMLMQAGELEAARRELAHASRLDPFHKRVNNQLRLAENLLGTYETIETEHFIIRYAPGIDEVLARDMPGPLEQIYDELTAVFQHRPANKTQIDIMPDQSSFAVRITGMPHIWTIAAATGDVISLTPPRSGPGQADPYNWVNVMRHEYVHTVTLAQTANRVPHWFTEACAVSVETTGRTYDTCQMLAAALAQDELFEYDQINWGFVRPKTPRDRPLAYAQSDWMLEFIATRWSHQAIVDLLELYRQGVSDIDALKRVTGYSADEFMQDFRGWARGEVKAWGFPEDYAGPGQEARLAQELESLGVDQLTQHFDAAEGSERVQIARRLAEVFVDSFDTQAAQRWLARYAQLRPVDPWPQKMLVKLAYDAGDPQAAVGPLRVLEKQDNYTSAWSKQLADLHRDAGRLDEAQRAIGRALHFEPYHAGYRELAATIALQRGDLAAAAFQCESLEILEPDRSIHPTRLAVIYQRLGEIENAKAAAQRARALDSAAPVGAILGE
jgi:tetratricopeptide (TPR) repeat protein